MLRSTQGSGTGRSIGIEVAPLFRLVLLHHSARRNTPEPVALSYFITRLVEEIDDIKDRLLKQSAVVERSAGDALQDEQATFRNLVMRLEGLELMLRKTQEQAYGG